MLGVWSFAFNDAEEAKKAAEQAGKKIQSMAEPRLVPNITCHNGNLTYIFFNEHEEVATIIQVNERYKKVILSDVWDDRRDEIVGLVRDAVKENHGSPYNHATRIRENSETYNFPEKKQAEEAIHNVLNGLWASKIMFKPGESDRRNRQYYDIVISRGLLPMKLILKNHRKSADLVLESDIYFGLNAEQRKEAHALDNTVTYIKNLFAEKSRDAGGTLHTPTIDR